jgi:signal peptidase II
MVSLYFRSLRQLAELFDVSTGTGARPLLAPAPLLLWRYALLLLVACFVIAADQLSKALVTFELENGRMVKILGGLLQLDYTQNTGAAFGLMRARGLIFVVIAVAVSLGILVSYRRIAASSLLVRLSLGLVLGGAVGNLIDRIRLGYVVDFIDLRWWPVFNLADSAIVIGVGLLIIHALLSPARERT